MLLKQYEELLPMYEEHMNEKKLKEGSKQVIKEGIERYLYYMDKLDPAMLMAHLFMITQVQNFMGRWLNVSLSITMIKPCYF